MKKNLLVFLFIFYCFYFNVSAQAPVTGASPTTNDFRTKQSGDWSTNTTWQVRDAAGNWSDAIVGQIPTASNNVYIQAAHAITVNSNNACQDFHLNSTGSIAVATNTTLQICRKIRSFSLNPVSISNVGSPTGTVATVTTTTNHSFVVGQRVGITGVSINPSAAAAAFNGTVVITGVTPNTFSFTPLNSTLVASTAVTGVTVQAPVVAAGADPTNTFFTTQANATPSTGITTTGTGKLLFTSTTSITLSGEWGANITSWNAEFATTGTAVLNTSFKAGNIVFSAGIINAQANRIAPDNSGTGGSVTIKSGATLISSQNGITAGNQVFSRLSGSTAGNAVRCGAVTIESGGVLELRGVTTSMDVTSFTNNGTVFYNSVSGTTGALLRPTGTDNSGLAATAVQLNNYNKLIIGGSGTKTAQSDVVVRDSLIVNTGNTFDLFLNQLTGGLPISIKVKNDGLVKTNCTVNPPIPAGFIWGDVTYSNGSAMQYVVKGYYRNLTFSNSSTTAYTLPLNDTVFVSGTFTPGLATVSNILNGSTFNFNGTTTQTVPPGYYHNLVVSNNSANVILSGAASNTGAGVVYVFNNFVPSASTTAQSNTGLLNTVNFNNTAGGQTVPRFNFYHLTVSNTSSTNQTTYVADTIGIAGLFTTGTGANNVRVGNTINFNNSAGGQTIPAFNYYNVIFSNNTATNTLAASPAVINVVNSLRTAGAKTLTPGIGTINYSPGATFYSNTTTDDILQTNSPHWPALNGPTNVEINSTSLRFQPPTSTTDSVSIINVQLTGNLATITAIRTLNFTPGTVVTIGGLNNSEYGAVFGGTFTISSVSGNTFSFTLTNPDIPSTAVTGGVSVSKINRSIPGNGILKLNGGNLVIYAGNKLTMENGSTIFRNLSSSVITPQNGFLSIGSTSTDKVNITIGNSMSSGNEFSYLATPGKYGTLKIISGSYYLAGSRTIVDLDNSGILTLNDTTITNVIINGNLIGSGTITGTPLCNLKFFGTNSGSVGNLRFTTGSQNLLGLYFNRTGAGALLTLATNLNIVQDFNLSAGSVADGGNTITVGGNISGYGVHSSTAAGKIMMTGTAASHQILSSSSLTFGNLDINPGAANTIGGYSSFLVTKDLTLSSGILDGANNSIITLQGNLNGTATYTGTGKIKMTGSDMTIAAVTVDSIEIATGATISAVAPFNIVKGLLLNGSLNDDVYQITNAGLIYGAGIHTGNGRIKMTGSAKSILGRPSLTNIEVATNASITSGCSAIINGTLYMNGNNVTVDAGNTLTFSNNSTIIRTSGNLNLNTGSVQMGTTTTDVVNVFINGNLESTNELPGTTTGKIDLTINAGYSYTLKSNHKTVRNLFLNEGGHLATLFDTVARTSYNLTVNNIASVLGNFYLDSTTYNYLGSFKIGPSLIINSNGKLKFGNVTGKALYSNGLLVLKSRKEGTASVADVTNGGPNLNNKILGTVTVERYISHVKNLLTDADRSVKAWRLLSMPTKHDCQTIKQAWQEGGSLNSNPNPGYGTQLVSNVANWAAAGFDTASPAPSIKYYDAASANYVGVSSTNLPFEQGKAYMVFIRGSRAKTLISQAPDSTILRERGSLIVGDTLISVGSAANQFVAVANPYASAIDFQSLAKTNISSYLYLYDPRLNTYGGFVTVGSDGVAVPPSGSYAFGNTYIQSSQGFLVKTTTGPGTIVFKEMAKVDGSFMTSRTANEPMASLRTNLYRVINGENVLTDGTMSVFDSAYSNLIDQHDAVKFNNQYENISIQNDAQNLAIEYRSLPAVSDTFFYQVGHLKQASYRLSFSPNNLPSFGMDAFLEDTYLQVCSPVSLITGTTLDFTVTSNPASYAANRFRLIFRPTVALPVTITSVKATNKNNVVVVDWQVENQINILDYKVEKSKDGINFNEIGSEIAIQGLAHDYSFTDAEVTAGGLYFYRIKSRSADGSVAYSIVVKIQLSASEPTIVISPNPIAADRIMNISDNTSSTGNCNLILYDFSGKKVAYRSWCRSTTDSQLNWKLPMSLPAGQYRLCLVNGVTRSYQSVILK